MKRVLITPKDRVYNHIYPFLVFMDSFYVSYVFHKNGVIEKDYSGYVTIEGGSIKLEVRLPIYGPMISVVQNSKPELIEIMLLENERLELTKDRSITSDVVDFIFFPVFVNYYESIKHEIFSLMGSPDQKKWISDVFRMGRVVRNSLSHDRKISLSDMKSQDVFWRNKLISTKNHNDLFHEHFNYTDVFILMLDIDEEIANYKGK
jgi:hypothetical protein